LDFLSDELSTFHVIESEIFLFLAITIQMALSSQQLEYYWSTTEQTATPFQSKRVRCNRFLQILRFHHLSNNDNAVDNNGSNFDRLWIVRHVSDMLDSNSLTGAESSFRSCQPLRYSRISQYFMEPRGSL
jgi:hypothetical protein